MSTQDNYTNKKTDAYWDAMMANKFCDFVEFLEEELGWQTTHEIIEKWNKLHDNL